MSQTAASTSKWDAGDYARVGAFVAELGGAALDLLDPRPGERILDILRLRGTTDDGVVWSDRRIRGPVEG